MKIAIISKSAASGGGASRIAELQGLWLSELGHTVTHFCSHIVSQPNTLQRPLHSYPFAGQICQLGYKVLNRLWVHEAIPIELVLCAAPDFSKFDIVHFHDHFTAYSPYLVRNASKRSKTFFTAHDCLHYTGTELYPDGAKKLNILEQWSRHVNVITAEKFNVTYLYPSKWLQQEASMALNFKHTSHVLYNGIDTAEYKFKNRQEARQLLGLPSNRPIICITAHALSDSRKGADFAITAIQSIAHLKPIVLLVGNPDYKTSVESKLLGIPYYFTGYIRERSQIGLFYAAADITLVCSLHDNLPIVVQESMAAGTPVVGFSTGGIPELTNSNETAWLVPPKDQMALNACLAEALANLGSKDELARLRIDSVFSKEQYVQGLLKIYENK